MIQDHLELKRRNAALEYEMPLAKYITHAPPPRPPTSHQPDTDDPIEDTLEGPIAAEKTMFGWPTEAEVGITSAPEAVVENSRRDQDFPPEETPPRDFD